MSNLTIFWAVDTSFGGGRGDEEGPYALFRDKERALGAAREALAGVEGVEETEDEESTLTTVRFCVDGETLATVRGLPLLG